MKYRYRLATEIHVTLIESDTLSDCLMVYFVLKTVSSYKNDSSFYMITIRDRVKGMDIYCYDLEAKKVIVEP